MGVQHDLLGLNFDSHNANACTLGLLPERYALPNPVDDRLVVGRVDAELLSATVGNTHDWLQQEQAIFGLLQIDARVFRSLRFGTEDLVRSPFDDPLVIFSRVQRIGGQLESTFALHAAMAIVSVTATLRQNRSNVTSKAEWSFLGGSRHRQTGFSGLSVKVSAECRRAVESRDEPAMFLEGCDSIVGNGEPCLGGDVPFDAICVETQQDKSLGGTGSPQSWIFRQDAEGK